MRKTLKLFLALVLFLVLSWTNAQAQLKCEMTDDPAKVQFIYDDVKNFLQAMDMLGKGGDPESILQKEYLDKATPGLKEYISESDATAKRFVETIQKKQDQYSALHELLDQLIPQEDYIRKAFSELGKVVPNPVFIPVYYFIGIGSGGLNAQPSEYGIIVAITDLAEDPSLLRVPLVHEVIHVKNALTVGIEEYMQVFGPKMSLLSLCIREGTAYFLTLLSIGEHGHKDAYDYYLKNEKKLWEMFKADMIKSSPEEWLFVAHSDPELPAHLGYVIGSRIVEAYYNRAEDKKKAVQDILSVIDFEEFFKKSGYAEKFSKQQ
jgi:hypothetical protein